MKRIDELSKKEILELSDDDIEQLIDLECAINGVPLVPPLPQKPIVSEVKPDLEIYRIGDVVFQNYSEAIAVIEAYDQADIYRMGYGEKYPKLIFSDDYNYPKIKKEKVMSAELYNSIKEEKEANDALLKEYESQEKLYNDIVSRQKQYKESVHNIVKEVWEEKHTKDSYKAEFDRYLILSDDNPTIAWNFLVSAHKDAEAIEGLRSELVPSEGTAE